MCIGASTISDTAPLATDQAAPFTAVLEADLDSGSYKVYYKDGSNPSQFLGIGAIAPTRDANSVRFAANNFFADGNFYPATIVEHFSIDRIAVTDTNPLSDFLRVTIDRDTGAIELENGTGTALSGLLSYSIESSAGSLNPDGWRTVAGNYDSLGDESVDDNTWSVDMSTASLLSESADDASGGMLSAGQTVELSGPGEGAWLQSPFEDVTVKLNFDDGVTRSADVTFEGNGGERFQVGDLNFDGDINVEDWTTFIAGAETDLTGLTDAEAYRMGDLDGDSVNSIFDVGVFKDAFDTANGAGAFDAMIAAVPEPAGWGLAAVAGLVLLRNRRRAAALCAFAAFALAVAQPARAAVLEDFPFTDVDGAALNEVENVANPGSVWNEDTGPMTGSRVVGGVYRIQKDNDDFGTNYLDIANITSGKAWLVAQIAGWNFSSIVGPGEFDSEQLEEVRFDFLNNDGSDQGGSMITAEMEIERSDTGGLMIQGSALEGGTPVSPSPLPLVQSEPFTMVLEYDGMANTYEIFTKSGAGSFTSVGTGTTSAARDANSIRFVANNNFSGTDEFFDIDRLYLTDESPIVDPLDPLTLRVNQDTGQAWIVNGSTVAYEFDSYRIESPSGALRVGDAFWSSLSDQLLNAVDGDDPDEAVGNGVGETWDEAGGSDANVLAESFLLGMSPLAPGEMIALGAPFSPGGLQELMFQYRRADTGAVLQGLIEFVTGGLEGDYNADGVVDARDYATWRDTLGETVTAGSGADGDSSGMVDAADYSIWRSNYGQAGAAAPAQTAPEPSSATLALILSLAAGLRRNRAARAGTSAPRRATCTSRWTTRSRGR